MIKKLKTKVIVQLNCKILCWLVDYYPWRKSVDILEIFCMDLGSNRDYYLCLDVARCAQPCLACPNILKLLRVPLIDLDIMVRLKIVHNERLLNFKQKQMCFLLKMIHGASINRLKQFQDCLDCRIIWSSIFLEGINQCLRFFL